MKSKLLACALCFVSLVNAPAQAQDAPDAQQALRFEGYPGAPEIEVIPRKDDLFFYPCKQCHGFLEPNPEIRELVAPHVINFEHGRGRIWCLSCHDLENRDALRTLLGEPVDLDEAHLVCGGCHANRHKDWYFGAHGKRVVDWQGERKVYNCTHCHDAHAPAIKPRAPKPVPPVRAGLERQIGIQHEKSPVWDSQEEHEEQ